MTICKVLIKIVRSRSAKLIKWNFKVSFPIHFLTFLELTFFKLLLGKFLMINGDINWKMLNVFAMPFESLWAKKCIDWLPKKQWNAEEKLIQFICNRWYLLLLFQTKKQDKTSKADYSHVRIDKSVSYNFCSHVCLMILGRFTYVEDASIHWTKKDYLSFS